MDFDALGDFLAVAEAGGVSAGARALGRPKQTVSRRLAVLEAELGVRLFTRSTRRLGLTAEGLILKERAVRLLADLEDARRTVADQGAAPTGRVRVSAPTLLGETVLPELAARTLATYPGLKLDVVLSDRRVDLIEEGFDVAIRVGRGADSDLIARTVAEADLVLVAAPGLMAGRAAIKTPTDLSGWPCVAFTDGQRVRPWVLRRGEEVGDRVPDGALTASSLMLCLGAAVAGLGVTQVPAFIAAGALRSGRLVAVLPEWRPPAVPIQLIHPSRRLVSARLRVFLEIADRVLKEVPFRMPAAGSTPGRAAAAEMVDATGIEPVTPSV